MEDGSYVVLNREYKPLGFNSQQHFNYEEYPISAKIKGLTSKSIKKLAWNEAITDEGYIFLYNDKLIPTRSKLNMKMYLEKLEILASYKIGV